MDIEREGGKLHLHRVVVQNKSDCRFYYSEMLDFDHSETRGRENEELIKTNVEMHSTETFLKKKKKNARGKKGRKLRDGKYLILT